MVRPWFPILAFTCLGAACHDGGAAGTQGTGEDQLATPDRAYYVAPNGRDTDPGTQALPWQTVRRGIAALHAGDTLILRGGIYYESGITLAASGTPSAPITIRNHPGETVVLDGSIAAFRTPGNNDWEPIDDGRRIYRSTARFPGAGVVEGYLSDAQGGYHLVPYEQYGPFSSDEEDYQPAPPLYYCGPGVYWSPDDQHIYIRLQHSKYQEPMGVAFPSDTDPRQNQLFLFPEGSIFEFAPGTGNVAVDGLEFRHRGLPLHVRDNCHDLAFTNCTVRGGRYGIVVRNGANHLAFDRLLVRGSFPPWVARSDVKRPEPGRPAHQMQGAALFFEGRTEQIDVGNSTFIGLFDGIDTSATQVKMRVHDCSFTTIRDDAFEIGSSGYAIEFDHNVVVAACVGVSWTGTNGSPPPAYVGTKYIHHNVIDTSIPQLYGRSDPRKLLQESWRGPLGDGMATGRAFGTHDQSTIPGPDPWRVYHNTIVGRLDVDNGGSGVSYRFPPADPSRPHAVFNNIFVQLDGTFVAGGARVADGSQVFDGNLYFQPNAPPNRVLLRDYRSGSQTSSFGSLSQFLASPFWSTTLAHYAPGWESSGVEGDPLLFFDYHPSLAGAAASGAVSLAATGWPGLANETFRGALAPR